MKTRIISKISVFMMLIITGVTFNSCINDANGSVTIAATGLDNAGCTLYAITFSEEALNDSDTAMIFENITFRQDGSQFIANHTAIGAQTLVINNTDNTLQVRVGSITFNGTLGDGGDTGGDGNATVLDLDVTEGVLFGIDIELTLNETYVIPVVLGANGVSFNEDLEELMGTGNIIELDFYSDTPELAAGTYTRRDNQGSLTFDGDVENFPSDNQGYTIEAGTVTVSYVGNEVVITYDLSLDSDMDAGLEIDTTTTGEFRGELFQLGACFVTLPDSLLGTFEGSFVDQTGSVTVSLETDGTYTISYSNGADTTTNVSFCSEEDLGGTIYIFEGEGIDISFMIYSDGEIEIDISSPDVTFSNQA